MPELTTDPCVEIAVVLDTPRFRLSADRCPLPAIAETSGERLCSWTVVAEGSRIHLEPHRCPVDGPPAPEWTFTLSSPVAVRTELLRISVLSPQATDPRAGVFVAALPADALGLEVPAPMVRLGEDLLCGIETPRAWRVGEDEVCDVAWVVDWFGQAWRAGVSGCAVDPVHQALDWHPRFCAWHADGVPQVAMHRERIQLLR